jgi:hypothetical protein
LIDVSNPLVNVIIKDVFSQISVFSLAILVIGGILIFAGLKIKASNKNSN